MSRLQQIAELVKDIQKLPRVTLGLWGDDSIHTIYKSFIKPHPRYKIIRNKAIGVALIELPESLDAFLKGKEKQAFRTNRNKAIKLGYTARFFHSPDFAEQIFAVNTSSQERQGHEMSASYTDLSQVKEYCAKYPHLFGVFNPEGSLCAYIHPIECGEIVLLNRILGHAEHVNNGVMYFMLSALIDELTQKGTLNEQPDPRGRVRFIMYDTYFGAADGLKYFKERLGFKPYRVKWRWR